MHKNSQKRFYHDEATYFVTAKTQDNFSYFRESIFCELWIEELKLCKEIQKFELYAFCLNHEHFHLLVKPNEEGDISKVMKFFKENFSRDANKVIRFEGDTAPCRLQGIGAKQKLVMNDVIQNFQKQFFCKYGSHQTAIPPFCWQKSFHDHVVRGVQDFEHHFGYTVYNFLKHNLPEDWKYTSLNFPEMVDDCT